MKSLIVALILSLTIAFPAFAQKSDAEKINYWADYIQEAVECTAEWAIEAVACASKAGGHGTLITEVGITEAFETIMALPDVIRIGIAEHLEKGPMMTIASRNDDSELPLLELYQQYIKALRTDDSKKMGELKKKLLATIGQHFNGVWKTAFGDLTLNVAADGSTTGSYEYRLKTGGVVEGELVGQADGYILRVTRWTETLAGAKDAHGTAELKMNSEGTEFNGPWKTIKGKTAVPSGTWSGTLIRRK